MTEVFSPQKLHRKNFGKIEKIIDISNLIEMQKESYDRFLQKDTPPELRDEYGLQGYLEVSFRLKIITAPPPWNLSAIVLRLQSMMRKNVCSGV